MIEISLLGFPESDRPLTDNYDAMLAWLDRYWVFETIVNVGSECRYGFTPKAIFPWEFAS